MRPPDRRVTEDASAEADGPDAALGILTRFADYVGRFASSGGARHLHAQSLCRGLQQRHIALTPSVSGSLKARRAAG